MTIKKQTQSSAVLQAAYTLNIFELFEAGDTAQRLSEKTGAEKLLIGKGGFWAACFPEIRKY